VGEPSPKYKWGGAENLQTLLTQGGCSKTHPVYRVIIWEKRIGKGQPFNQGTHQSLVKFPQMVGRGPRKTKRGPRKCQIKQMFPQGFSTPNHPIQVKKFPKKFAEEVAQQTFPKSLWEWG